MPRASHRRADRLLLQIIRPDLAHFDANDGRQPCGHKRQGDDAWGECTRCEELAEAMNEDER